VWYCSASRIKETPPPTGPLIAAAKVWPIKSQLRTNQAVVTDNKGQADWLGERIVHWASLRGKRPLATLFELLFIYFEFVVDFYGEWLCLVGGAQ